MRDLQVGSKGAKVLKESKRIALRITLLGLLLLLLMALVACTGKGGQPADGGSDETISGQSGGDRIDSGKTDTKGSAGSGQSGQEAEDEEDPWFDEVDLDGYSWRPDDMVAIAALGYLPYEDMDLYLESQDLQDFLDFHPMNDSYNVVVTDYMGIGDELYYIIPRYYDSEIVIKDAWDGEVVFYEGRGDEPILLLTNIGDLYTDAWITITYKGEELDVWPGLTGLGIDLVTPEYGVLDISPGQVHKEYSLEEENNIAMMEGDWILYYVTDGGYEEEAYISIFDLYDYSDAREYRFYYQGIYSDMEKEGELFFRSPIDFYDPTIDDLDNMLYIFAIEYGPQDRFQLFGKFQYEFMNQNNFRLYHLDDDPLHPGEFGYSYVLERTQFAG